MGVESNPLFPSDLNESWPSGSESRRDGDDHIRNIKAVIVNYLKTESGTAAYDTKDLLQAQYPKGRVLFSYPAGVAPNGLDDDIGGTSTKIGTITLDDGVTQIDAWNITRSPNEVV